MTVKFFVPLSAETNDADVDVALPSLLYTTAPVKPVSRIPASSVALIVKIVGTPATMKVGVTATPSLSVKSP